MHLGSKNAFKVHFNYCLSHRQKIIGNYFAAKVTFIVVPMPRCDFNSMSAPYSEAMCLTMASPSPVPPVSRLREALTL